MCENLIGVGYIYLAFALAYISNVVLVIVVNCLMHDEIFQPLRVFKSFLKLLVVAVVTASIVCGFGFLQLGAEKFGLVISDTVTDVISITSFLLLFSDGFIKIAKDVYDKIKEVFELGTETIFRIGESGDGIG